MTRGPGNKRERFPHKKRKDSLLSLCMHNITPLQSGTTQPHHAKKTENSVFTAHRLLKINLPSLGLFLSVSVPMCMMMTMESEKNKKRKPQLSGRVAHGKVCTGARTLSVWVKDMQPVGVGSCWVTSPCDIRLTETNAHGVAVKNDPFHLALIQLAFKPCPKVEPKATVAQLKWREAKSDFSSPTVSPSSRQVTSSCDACHLANTSSLHLQGKRTCP